MGWIPKTSHTERYHVSLPADVRRARAWHVEKHERVTLQYVMLKDCADGSRRVLDMVVIAGYDRVLKLPTARAVITTGRHNGLTHAGDYSVQDKVALDYSPICSLHVRVNLEKGPKPTGRKGAENAARMVVEHLARRAHGADLWLPLLAKRRRGNCRAGLIQHMSYYGVKDNWRVPQSKLEGYKNGIKLHAQLKKQTAWAFEEVKTVADGGHLA